MSVLASITITAPVTSAVGLALEFRSPPSHVAVQASFVYGSGGTSITSWLQTSLDAGVSWIDVAAFGFTTSTAKAAANLSALTPVAIFTPTDGTLASGSVRDGIVGGLWRVKTTSTGTYAGGTSLRIDIAGLTL